MSGQDWVNAFDTLFTNNRIQKLKIILPLLAPSLQKSMAIYIKYLELQYTISFFQWHTGSIPFPGNFSGDPGELCDAMMPYCTASEKRDLANLRNLLQTLGQYKEMMEMMQLMQEMFPQENKDSDNASDTGGSLDISQILDLFQTMSSLSGNPGNTNEKEE